MMRSTYYLIPATLLSIASALASIPCPLLNAYYPPPNNLTSSPHVKSAASTLESQILQVLQNSSKFGQLDASTTAFSVDVYSTHNNQPLFTYHYTPEYLASKRTSGVAGVDSNSVYRIGSVSKLWTVFIYLKAAGDASWNLPITQFVPELAAIAREKPALANEVDSVPWDSITVGALASQMAGIGRDAAYSAELAAGLTSLGLTNQGGNSHSTCGDAARTMLPCNRTAFFEDFLTQHPVTNPFQTPVYSNAAFQILSYALENITGASMEDLFADSLIEPLALNGTFYRTPPTTNSSIIPYNTTISWWDGNSLGETPAGGYYSSINDMRAIGKAMLDSSLLSPAQTRRWMKPATFTSDPNIAVGAPWEIMRAPGDPVSWMYTKSGDIGMYSALVGLMPDLGLGFSILAAGENPTSQVQTVASIVAENFVVALWEQAKDETSASYAGIYTDESTNSTLTALTPLYGPGLVIEQFTIGGDDVLSLLGSMLGAELTLRLYPMSLSTRGDNGTNIVSWRAIFESQSAPSPVSSCVSWLQVNPYIYGGVGLDEFLFVLDSSGHNAISIESRIVGVSQSKVNNTNYETMKMAKRRIGF